MATDFNILMQTIMGKVESGKEANRYEDMIKYIEASDMAETQKTSYIENFDKIYRGLCDSITRKSLSRANSGLEQNTEYITMLRTLKYNLASIAVTRLEEGKPLTLYTDSVKGPQGDLLEAMRRIKNIKNFIPNLVGVKLPQEDSKKSQIDDKFSLGDRQQFIALCPEGMKDIDDYYSILHSRLLEEFSECPQVSFAYNAFRGLLENSAKQNGTNLYTKEYFGKYRYAESRFLESLLSKMEEDGNFAICFENGKPVGDLKEAVKGTMFDTDMYKTVGVPLILKWKVPGSIDGYEYSMGADYMKGKPALSNTYAAVYTKYDLSSFPIRPFAFAERGKTRLTEKEFAKNKYRTMTESTEDEDFAERLINLGYTQQQVDDLAKKIYGIQRGRYNTPVVKKALAQSEIKGLISAKSKVEKPKVENVEVVKANIGEIFIPLRMQENYQQRRGSAIRYNTSEDKTAKIASAMAEAQKIHLENQVKGIYDCTDDIIESVAVQTVLKTPTEEEFSACEIYESVLRQYVYKYTSQALANDQALVLELGKDGAKGALKQIIEKASQETISCRPEFFGADPKRAKSVVVRDGEESIEADKITISRDGVKAERVQADDRVQ